MGTHPSGPSQLILQDAEGLSLLKDWLIAHPEALGEKVNARWNGALPFLFKVRTCIRPFGVFVPGGGGSLRCSYQLVDFVSSFR